MFTAAPLDPVYLVFTMIHLYPSKGVLAGVNAAFLRSLVASKNIRDCDYWGSRTQTSAAFGLFEPQSSTNTAPSPSDKVLFSLETDNSAITHPLQIALLNRCYRRLVASMSEIRLSLGDSDIFSSLLNLQFGQRALLFPGSWPRHIADELMMSEIRLKAIPEISFSLSVPTVKSLIAYGMFVGIEANRLCDKISTFTENQPADDASTFSGYLHDYRLAGVIEDLDTTEGL